MAAGVSARVSALDAYLCRGVEEGLQGDVMRFNYCGIIRICLRRREGYLSTTTITSTSRSKGFKVARVVLQKINVADEIVCSSSPKAGPAGWYRCWRGAVFVGCWRKEDDPETRAGAVLVGTDGITDGMTWVLTGTIIFEEVGSSISRSMKQNFYWKLKIDIVVLLIII